MDRVIVLIDMDCFYVQVEQRANPSLKGKPCAVVQYNTWKGGAIIAVGYEARAKGVTRQMRGNDAKAKCPEIVLVSVPEVRGKANLTRYREAGAEVIEVFSKFSSCVERASIDEAFIDLTEEVKKRLESMAYENLPEDKLPNSHVIGFEVKSDDKEKSVIRQEGVSNFLQSIYESEETSEADLQLAMGAVIVEEMRAAVYEETGFRCSAGIAHNKILAKLSAGLHKPNKQTVLPHNSVTDFFTTMPISKVRGFGGKFGFAVKEILQVEYMAELQQFSLKKLQDCLGGKSGPWVHDICRGYEYESVSARQLPKSVGCSKNFGGPEKLDTKEKVKHWLLSLAKEVVERLEKDKEQNKRKARNMIVGIRQDLGNDSSYSSRTCAIVKYDAGKLANDGLVLLSKFNRASGNQLFWDPPLLNLSMCASKFTDVAPEGSTSITSFMTQGATPRSRSPSLAEHLIDYEKAKAKKSPQPRGIELFLSQPSSSLQGNNSSDIAVNYQQPPMESKSEIGKSWKPSFFQKYLAKQNANSEEETITAVENACVTSSSDISYLNDESGLDDFDISSRGPTKSRQAVNVAIAGQDIYDVDTDYSDSENIDTDIMRTEFHEEPNDSDNHSKDLSLLSGANNEIYGDPQISGMEQQSTNSSLTIGACTDNIEDMMTCEECGKSVLVWEFPEHSDFHFAMKLHQETKKDQKPLTLDDLPAKRNDVTAKRNDVTPLSNRGRKKAKLSGAKMKTLDNFFKS